MRLCFELTIGVVTLAAAACTQPSDTQVGGSGGCIGSACGKSTTGRAVGGATGTSSRSTGTTGDSATAGSSSGGSTGGATGAGSSSGGSGGSTGAAFTGNLVACPSGFHPNCAATICSTVYDFTDGMAKPGVLLTMLDPNGVPLSGTSTQYTSASDGSFYLCAPVNTPFYVEASIAGYQTADTALLTEPGGPDTFFGFFNQFALFSTGDFQGFGFILNPALVPGTSMVFVLVADFGGECSDGLGYTLSAVLPDGGTLEDGGALPFNVNYIDENGPNASLTATTDAGAALIYNIDSTQTSYISVTVANPSVPAHCTIPVLSLADLTGLVPVGEGSFSETGVPVQ